MEKHIYPQGCVFKSLDDIKNKHVTIMGLGLNGGGEACVKFFLHHGAYVTVTDMKTPSELAQTINSLDSDKTLNHSRLHYVLGEHRIEDFKNADCVIKNPGVKYEGNKFLAAAKAIETDLSIFLSFTKAPIIAVTGSKGKSSTVSAIDFGLRMSGFQTFLGGNITVSPLTFLEKTDGTTPVVLELSSWQLADLRGRKVLKPHIAIITKIVPDHQNWYENMDSYVADKELIFADMDEKDFLLLDYDEDDYLKETENPLPFCKSWGDYFAVKAKTTILRYSKNVLPEKIYGSFQSKNSKNETEGFIKLPFELKSRYAQSHNLKQEKIMGSLLVPGEHNKINVLNAATVLYLMGVAPEMIIKILGSWKGIPHRLERFYDWKSPSDSRNVIFYNDSCSTVPEAAAAASQSFEKRVVLIAGGTDKNLDFLPLAKTLKGENGTEFLPREIYLLSGSGTDKLTELLDQENVEYNGPFDSLEILLGVLKDSLISGNAKRLYGDSKIEGDLPVVFSPGATSFGMFANEFDRGNKFKNLVKMIF